MYPLRRYFLLLFLLTFSYLCIKESLLFRSGLIEEEIFTDLYTTWSNKYMSFVAIIVNDRDHYISKTGNSRISEFYVLGLYFIEVPFEVFSKSDVFGEKILLKYLSILGLQ